MSTKQTYLPFFGSRIFWIALVVIAAFTAMIISGKLVLDGAAVTAFLLAVFSGVVGLSRREQGDAGAPAAQPVPPEMIDAFAAFARSMARQGGDALDDYVEVGAAEESADEETGQEAYRRRSEEKEGDGS